MSFSFSHFCLRILCVSVVDFLLNFWSTQWNYVIILR
jgi:hypothetical protein